MAIFGNEEGTKKSHCLGAVLRTYIMKDADYNLPL